MARPKAQIPGETLSKIVDSAETLICERGYNGFSFRDIAESIGIRTASIHYHFPTKGDLGAQVASRYTARFADALRDIEAGTEDAIGRLRAYAGLFRTALVDRDRMCLCGMLGAESATLPQAVRTEAEGFFALNRGWLETVLAKGVESGALRFRPSPHAQANLLLAALEGAMLLARTGEDFHVFDMIAGAAIDPLANG